MPTRPPLHHPTPQTRLPAHEEAARARRAALLHLATPTKPTPPQQPTPHGGGRKTIDVNYPNLRH